jgi:hypothetical protein
MSRKPKGTGGRNAISQDLLRDNYEDMDMDPNATIAANEDNINTNVLFPQIPPPLSANLMDTISAQCILKMSCISRKFKLSEYYMIHDGVKNSSSNNNSNNNSKPNDNNRNNTNNANAKYLEFVNNVPNKLSYFPSELLHDYGVKSISGNKRSRSRTSGTNSGTGSGRTKKSGGNELFGKLERQERAAIDPNVAQSDGADKTGNVANVDVADLGSDAEEEVDEYDLDDDYGLNHTFSDDDGGGDGDSDGEPTY